MNEEIILKMIKPYLKNSSITYDEFDNLFEMLSLKEQYGVLEVLNKNDIELTADEEESDDIESLCETELRDEDDFEILYDDSVFSDQDYGGEKPDDVYSGFLEIKKKIAQSNEILCVLIQQGNKQARQDLCIKNRRLVDKLAIRYDKFLGNGLSVDDLEQAGMLGMITAAEKFDPRRGYAFSTYATWWIRHMIIREIYDHGFMIRVPVHMMEMIHKINVLDRDLSLAGIGCKDRMKAIAEELDITEEYIDKCMAVQSNFLNTASLDVPVGESEDVTMHELVQDETMASVEDEVFTNILREQVVDVLQILTQREQEVLDLRYGLTDGRERTLEEVGSIFGVTRERIRQIEAKAFRKLRCSDKSKYFRDF